MNTSESSCHSSTPPTIFSFFCKSLAILRVGSSSSERPSLGQFPEQNLNSGELIIPSPALSSN